MPNTSLPNILVQSLKLEYESTPITIEELCSKHKIKLENIPYTSWNKPNEVIHSELVPSSTSSRGLLQESYGEEEDLEDVSEASEIQSSINKTAKSIISQVNTYMIETTDLTAKDIKDLSSALISLKESVLGKDPTVKVEVNNSTQVNILNHLVSAIKGAERDC